MRVISMHKATPDMEAGAPPPPEVLAGMGPLLGEMMQSGIFVAGEGLRPSSQGVRLQFSSGNRTITKGPLRGENELLSAYAIVKTASIDEAIEFASRGAAPDAVIDVRPVTEPWDFGAPRPANETKTRYMVIYKADARSESGAHPAEISDPLVIAAGRLQPSSKGRRLFFRDGKPAVTDGPFTESKELIAGFSILEVPSIDDAVPWATRFAKLLGDIEIEMRPLY
jgi:hypothetical protein